MNVPSKVLPNSLGFRQQLVLIFSLGIICLALATSLVISSITTQAVYEQMFKQGRKTTDAFSEQSTLALLYLSEDNAKDAAKSTMAFPDVTGVAIVTVNEKWQYAEGVSTNPSGVIKKRRTENHYKETSRAWYFSAPVYAGGDVSENDSPFVGEPQVEHELIGYVRVVVSKERLAVLTTEILQSNVLVSFGLAGVLLLLLLGMTKRLTQPLHELAEVMGEAEDGDIQVRANLKGSKEIVLMEKAFNTMMNQLEQRQQELQRARDSALGVANAKGEFAATVSHELRTPMNGIMGMLDLLGRSEVSQRQKEYIKVATQSGDALLMLIDDILDFSKIESGKMRISLVNYDPQELIGDIVELLSTQAKQKNLTINAKIESKTPKVLRGDSGRIRQVLINLIGNAIKFTEQGSVDISMMIEGDSTLPMFRVVVKDTGVGIAKNAQKRIFDAFSQADGSTTRKYGGTGLGLTICRQLVELMGGKMGVESETGKGSAFWFTLPLDAVHDEIVQDEIDVDQLNGVRVLIVTEEPVLREQLTDCFSEWQCFYRKVGKGHAALSLLTRAREQGRAYDLLVADATLTDMSCFQFVDAINNTPDIGGMKVVVVDNGEDQGLIDDPSLLKVEVFVDAESFYQSVLALLEVHPPINVERKVNPPAEMPLVYLEEEISDIGMPRILVVEDNHTNQLVALGMLERLGCHSRVANQGEEALSMLDQQHFDLILMDCHMPILDGYLTTETIRKKETKEFHIPIVAMTAHAGRDDKVRCLQSGMDDYLPKPINFDELKRKLTHWLGVELEETDPDASQKLTTPAKDQPIQHALDIERFQTLRHRLGQNFPRVIDSFRENTPLYLDKLKYALKHTEDAQVRYLAHCIKGSFLNIGALPLANQCAELEVLCEAGIHVEAHELIKDIETGYLELQRVLNNQLTQQGEKAKEIRYVQPTILIVDDDPVALLTLHGMLERDGYFIIKAENGEKAVQVCQEKMPDLVLMDAVMPGVGGFDACRQILQLNSDIPPSILIITALHDEQSIEKAFDAGATDFIPKPINFTVLRKRVDRLLLSRRSEQHVQQLAYYDNLTNLPNRTQMMERARDLIIHANTSNTMLAVFFLDIDRFKMVNDTQGHDVGDLLLKTVSQRLQGCLRTVDLIARVGGDEFIILLDDIKSVEAAETVAKKVNASFAQPFSFMNQQVHVSVSIGVAMYPHNGGNIGTLMKRSDTAMFKAKAKGGNCYQFYEYGMETEIARRFELESELREAIDNEELVLYYQPQLDLRTGKVSGLEALVRWQHPVRGFLPPVEFISLAEETGLIIPLGDWVIKTACQQQRDWLNKGLDEVPIAVNVASIQWEGGALYKKVQAVLKDTGVPAHLLKLELTEETLADTEDAMITQMTKLTSLGVSLEIDDFGTGYSSLSYLKRFPVEVLKIDRCFIDGLPTDGDDVALVTGIIALGHSLNLKIIAEGVETAEQKQFLIEKNCDAMQGYYLSRPLSAEDSEEWLLEYCQTE